MPSLGSCAAQVAGIEEKLNKAKEVFKEAEDAHKAKLKEQTDKEAEVKKKNDASKAKLKVGVQPSRPMKTLCPQLSPWAGLSAPTETCGSTVGLLLLQEQKETEKLSKAKAKEAKKKEADAKAKRRGKNKDEAGAAALDKEAEKLVKESEKVREPYRESKRVFSRCC